MTSKAKPAHKVLLVILDGWGIRKERDSNAILLAGTPQLDKLAHDAAFAELQTSGLAVGLPDGQMGNSEVGHTNIGAGRIVYQDLVRINRATESGELGRNPVIRAAMDQAKSEGRALHLLGLTSPGGVHSSMEHLYGLLEAAKERGLPRVFVHAFLDGRDTPPQSALGHVEELSKVVHRTGARIATVSGRYYAMDRDKRWDRVKLAFDAMVRGEGPKAPDALAAIRAAYAEKVTDEFVKPTVIAAGDGSPVGRIQDGDVVLFFNFRADRAREMTQALAFDSFKEFDRGGLHLGRYVCMTQFDETFGLPVAFAPDQPTEIFPEIVSRAGLHQLRTAETEKYAHVTFFFNGGREVVFPGEDRVLIPSPRDVKTYDLKPEMSAREVTAELVKRLDSGNYDFALVNFANPDMVGHSGMLEPTMKAVRVVDECLGILGAACTRNGWVMAVSADHGNAEQMTDPQTGEPMTSHTLNPVPFYLIHPEFRGQRLRPGILADIAPTLLKVMGLPQPEAMNRQGLLP
ncbi:2,3-bisphosphoglycerate-independent phosphoglycerate mutase [Aggregicoccus sp. 17bor-14]|uniref:2,3-bisphosphoglycerate-independent phosphoglycerate mutase n=1 Tax=Myxococcaceae TaxID=31 RepID=UPI00129C265E|nr:MULTISPECIES: 2,3-bisphosphoglycerate-independent phosphoglycerate mutase [Myxococcaceae]MBF5046584.1 2,3-bisphosphoglycerate-independent phosphoglycerate mutase [Simulacricoccus sp. 17bor-14]MRI92295.1 2,3-bisphosphoglycerate-independent phosphoglycerate mutase [Aggregicoccus sp. 17bor-14]